MIYCQLCCLEFEDKNKLKEHEASIHSSFFCQKCDSYTTKKQTGRTRCQGCNEILDARERGKSVSPKDKGKTTSLTTLSSSSKKVTSPAPTSSVVRLIPLSSLMNPSANTPTPNLLSMQPQSPSSQTTISKPTPGPVYIRLPASMAKSSQSGASSIILVRKTSSSSTTTLPSPHPPSLPRVPPDNICLASNVPEDDPPPPILQPNVEINTGAVRGHVPKQPVQCPLCRQWFNSKDVIISKFSLYFGTNTSFMFLFYFSSSSPSSRLVSLQVL